MSNLSYAQAYVDFKFDIKDVVDISHLRDDLQRTGVGIKILVDSSQVRDRVAGQFEEQQRELILDLVKSQFSEYFAVYKEIQEKTSALNLS